MEEKQGLERYELTALQVAFLYDMINQEDLDDIAKKGIAFTIRSVFVIDPSKKVCTAHPAIKLTHEPLTPPVVLTFRISNADYPRRFV